MLRDARRDARGRPRGLRVRHAAYNAWWALVVAAKGIGARVDDFGAIHSPFKVIDACDRARGRKARAAAQFANVGLLVGIFYGNAAGADGNYVAGKIAELKRFIKQLPRRGARAR